MRVIEPFELHRWERTRRRRYSRRRWRSFLIGCIIVALLASLAYYRYQRPYAAPRFTAVSLSQPSNHPTINWPSYGQAAIGTTEDGVLAAHAADKPAPMASIAKLVTTLVILDKKPLALNEQGPSIVLTAADEALYHSYIGRGGSVSGVTAGRTITQYEALQSILLPSSNNMSETLSNWAFGSQQGYLEAAAQYLKSHKLDDTIVADASGFSPQTMSTADNLVRLGILAMQHPVVAQIVGQKTAHIQVAGTVMNTNRLLGVNNIVGIKTGNTDEAGGCYVLAAERTLANGQKKMIIAAVMGARTLSQAMADSRPLIDQTATNFKPYVAITAGQQLGVIKTAWDQQAAVLAGRDVIFFGWGDAPLNVQASVKPGATTQGEIVGSAAVSSAAGQQTIPLTLSDDLLGPSRSWRIGRIFTD